MNYTFVLGFAAAAVVLQVIRMVLASWQHSRKARELGCGSLPLFPCKDPIGIDTLKQSLAADKAKLLPELSSRRVGIVSEQEGRYVTTYVLRNLGRNLVFTIDPKNIQAVLATQFKDFELGEVRRHSMHPLLGTGIVSHMEISHLVLFFPLSCADQPSYLLMPKSLSSPPMERNGPDRVDCCARSLLESRSVSSSWRKNMYRKLCRPCLWPQMAGPPRPISKPSSSV
jgi:hypothetical protein